MLLIKKIPFVLLLITGINCAAQFAGSRSFKLLDDNRPFKINALFKSSTGYLYAGTTNGLYSFDGKNFKKINSNTPAVKDTITAVFEDHTGQIWAGFKSGRLAKKNKSLLQYFEPEEGTPKVAITAFLEDKQHNIWFATNGEGIYYFYNSHLYLINEDEGLSDKYVHALALADNGDVLAATDQGINICSVNGTKKTVTVLGPKNGLPDYYITAIQSTGNNNFIIGLQEKGFCLYNHSTKQITIPAAAANWNYGQVNALLYTQNNIWIATESNGLMQLPNTPSAAATDFITSNNKNNISNLLLDNEGNIWMTSTGELMSTAGDKLNLLPIYDKAVYETIHTILSDYQNNIWAGTDGGIIKYTRSTNQWTSRVYPIKGLTSFTDITGLYQDMYHNIWLSTMGEGIFVVDPLTGKYRNISENPLLKKASILSITGTGNTVCAGGLEGVATIFELSELNTSISAAYKFTNYDSIPNIGNNYIHTVFKDSKGRIWFGTDGKGITVLEKGRFKHFDKTNGLMDEHVYSFTEDKKGCIWFNTKDAGVYCYNDTTFKNFGAAQGISDLKITTIKTDRLGNLIIVNENGIDILDPATGTIAYLNNTQGITGVNTAIGSVCTDSSGNILLNTENGIVVYMPAAKSNLRPKTIIDNIQLFLKEIDPLTDHHFKYDENSFTFNFTGLYYTNPEQVHYQYKLEGLDTSWVSTKDQSIPFPNLRPGKYVFHVRSSLNDNFENADEVTYAFVIETPFWKRIWFILLSIIIVTSLLYWYMKSREKHLNKMQLLHQEKVEFQFQVLRNQVNPHFLFNSFNTLISTIEDNPKAAVDYVEQLSEFFRNIVNYRDKDVISLGEELQLMDTYFYLQQKRFGNSLVLKIDISEQLKKDCFVPPLTLQLLVENAIKHNAVSKESILSIHLYTENDNRLLISNNINPKISPEKGTGMGLQNIINRYHILSENPVLVNSANGYFTVSLPVLKQ